MTIPTNAPIHASYGSVGSTSETESAHPTADKAKALAKRSGNFARSHWKAIGLAALGLVMWRNRRLRPYVKKAMMAYVIPAAKNLIPVAKTVGKTVGGGAATVGRNIAPTAKHAFAAIRR